MRFFIAIAICVAALSAAGAQDAKHPAGVEKLFETAREECKDAAGKDADSKGVVIKEDAVRKRDLNGDNRDDYVVDFTHVSCDDNDAYFCGSGGCKLVLLVAQRNGSYATVWDDQVLAYVFRNPNHRQNVSLSLHQAFCSEGSCVKTGRVGDKKLHLKEEREIEYPAEVEAHLEHARKECKEADGGMVAVWRGAVRKLDLTGDGRADYIVDTREMTCDAFESLYCGTGGCNIAIVVAKRDGSYTTVFDGRVRHYDILGRKGAARKISFDLHGGYCGKAGAYPCPKSKVISDKPFEFKEPE